MAMHHGERSHYKIPSYISMRSASTLVMLFDLMAPSKRRLPDDEVPSYMQQAGWMTIPRESTAETPD